MKPGKQGAVWLLAMAWGLAGCAGEYGGEADAGNGGPSPGGSSVASERALFDARVQPTLDFCRTCHVPGGIADVENGREFMLVPDENTDYNNFRASWQRLGGNNPTSRILLMASGQETPHSGGSPWPVGSQAYNDVEALLRCFGDAAQCAALSAQQGTAEPDEPLLGSKHGGHLWFDFCEGKDDAALLPPDPRSLVQPGVSDGKAVHFNAYWVNCHADPELIGEDPQPTTCGELRASWARGEQLMRGNGGPKSGTFFGGDDHAGQALQISIDAYNRLWQLWGLDERPENYDYLVSQRYGMPIAPGRNPYPLPGEDPNATDGGSGQLPAFMTQLRGENGEWTGGFGFTCHACHSGAAGLPEEGGGFHYGLGNNLQDIALMAREVGMSGYSPGILFTLFGTSRGTNNASDVNIFFLANQNSGLRLDQYTLGMLLSGSTASGDTPSWWNMGSRPLKFQDGYFAGDSSRVDLIFYTPTDGVVGGQAGEDWVRDHAQHADKWIMSLKSPPYPLEVDTALAEQGAVLFHSKNLWAEGLNNPVPQPEGGNGSCASCHGAYSPRYVNDPAYLADPSMEGVASNIAPHEVIRTDRRRADTNNEAVNQYGSTSFLGYPETVGTENDCGPQNRAEIRGDRPLGYLAPPLYGVWASAPYLHNGSVPDVWTLLKPEERPELWRRVSTPKPEGAPAEIVMGYDVSMARAYDAEKLGWKYEVMACGTGTIPFLDCNPLIGGTPLPQLVLHELYGNVLLAWNLGQTPNFFQVTPDQIENRKIYNTNLYSQGNQGHDFTTVLTDQERRALIEYLKTL
jgi:endo-cleaving rubber dioxygenase